MIYKSLELWLQRDDSSLLIYSGANWISRIKRPLSRGKKVCLRSVYT